MSILAVRGNFTVLANGKRLPQCIPMSPFCWYTWDEFLSVFLCIKVNKESHWAFKAYHLSLSYFQSILSAWSTSGTTHQRCYMLILNIECTFPSNEQSLSRYLSCSSCCLTFTWLLELQWVTFSFTMISTHLPPTPPGDVLVENKIQLLYCLTLKYTNPGFCSPSVLRFLISSAVTFCLSIPQCCIDNMVWWWEWWQL